jgi:hypothetical protein
VDVRPDNIEDLIEIAAQLDQSRSVALENGRRSFAIRCRIPVILAAPTAGFRFKTSELGPRDAARATDAGGSAPKGEVLDRIEGPASSTSVDFYGTRMTKPCLEMMAEQFKKGVSYLPRHHSFLNTVEWFDQMGMTVDARLERAQVAEPAEGEEASDQWILYASTDLYDDNPMCETMLARIRAGRPPGQSIGGWFTEINVTYDEDGCVQYPIDVMGVELDHLAAVRSPANPDADKIWLAVQRQLDTLGQSLRAAPAPGPPATPAAVPDDNRATEADPEPEDERGACGSTSLPLADESTPWSFGAADANEILGDPPNWSRLKSCHFWFDPEKADTRDGYKLPFAKEFGGELKAVWHGVAAAYAATQGSHGGVDLPEADRAAVLRRIRRYYERFGKNWPEETQSADAPVEPDPAPETDAPRSAPVVEVVLDGSRIRDALAAASRRMPALFSRSAPGAAPSPSAAVRGRAPLETTMPMTEAELAELANQIRSTVAGALAPIVADIETLKTQRSAAPELPPAPAPAPTETAAERSQRERAERAEAEVARMQAEPVRVASRAAPASTTAPAAPTGVPEIFRVGRSTDLRTTDLRTIAPITARTIARAGDEIAPNEVPHLVWQRDGLKALASYAEASGEAPAVLGLVQAHKELVADATWIGPNGDDFGVLRGGMHPRPEQLRCRSDGELKELLRELCFAAVSDRLIR